MPFLLFYITHPDEQTARSIAEFLVKRRLVACANIFPVTSAYWWQQNIVHEGEWVSVLKTQPALEQHVEEAVRAQHPYEAPCILRFEVRANAEYEQWIVDETVSDTA
ncbi:MAG: divalent-cation tolerance protein CutA [Lewinellaceae bacterium]|jgi:periplasmic divalent cation tolerance protein|nr:divalent-cation tolerance protein CutA [Lewinellaceae bacterium]